jgi:hypothetical protein
VPSCRSGRYTFVCSAWWELTMRRPASIIPRAQSTLSYRAEALATKSYRRSNSGQPWCTPASHISGAAALPRTTTEAGVCWSSRRIHRRMPGPPTQRSIMAGRKARSMVSKAVAMSSRTTAPRCPSRDVFAATSCVWKTLSPISLPGKYAVCSAPMQAGVTWLKRSARGPAPCSRC